MSNYDAGVARGAYILDITQPKQAAAELRALFAGLRESTSVAPLAPQATGVQAYVAGLREVATASAAAASPTQALIESIRAEGVALGQTDEQINAHLAALSREALAVGDVTRANELQSAALGETDAQQTAGTAKSLQRTQAEARAAVAARDYAGALRLLSSELAGQGERTIGVINAERQLIQTQNQAAAAAEREALVEQRQADIAIRVAQQQARAALATKDYAGALQILNTARSENAGGSVTAVTGLETQIAQTEVAGTATGAFGAQLGALVSPLALVTAGFGLAVGAAKSFGDALDFAGKLEEERTAFGGILGDFRQGNQVIDVATARTRAYGFTAKETTDAFRELAPIIRDSTSSVGDQADALIRISVLKPDAPVQALASAIEGIKTGRFRELSKELGLSADEQKRLKDDVDGGKDAFIALNDVLDKHGITLDVAKTRMDGYEGATRRATQATENLKTAQARFAEGPGTAIVEAGTAAVNTTTGVFTHLSDLFAGDFSGAAKTARDGISGIAASMEKGNPIASAFGQILASATGATNTVAAATDAASTAILRAADADDREVVAIGAVIDMEDRRVQQINRVQQASAQAITDQLAGLNRSAAASATDSAAKAAQAAVTSKLTYETETAASAFLKLNPKMDLAGIIALVAAGKIPALTGQLAALRLEADKTTAALTGEKLKNQTGAQLTGPLGDEAGLRASNRAQQLDARTASVTKAQADARAADQARVNQLLATGTAAQKVAERQREYNAAVKQFGADSKQAIDAQTALIEAQQSAEKAGGRGRVSAAASTGLQLQNVEENTQAQLLKTQREGLERLRDQEQDYDLSRARSKEDEDRKIRGLLARGQRAEAARERDDFAIKQRRAAEDFNIQRQRAIRNNNESTGDIGARADLRTQQIDARAALRGVRPTGGTLPANLAPAPVGTQAVGTSAGRQQIAQLTIQGVFNIDGKAAGKAVFPTVEILMDESLAISLQQIGVPNAGQLAVGGPG